MAYVAVKLVSGELGGRLIWGIVALGASSAVAFGFNAPPPLVLLGAGAIGIWLFR